MVVARVASASRRRAAWSACKNASSRRQACLRNLWLSLECARCREAEAGHEQSVDHASRPGAAAAGSVVPPAMI